MQIISWRQAGWRMPPPEHGGMHTHIYVCRERRTNRKHNASGSIREDTHTHTRLTALCPGLPGSAGTRNVKPIWILLKQETVSGSDISWATCKSASQSRQITMPAPNYSGFYRPDALPAAQPTASKHWRHKAPLEKTYKSKVRTITDVSSVSSRLAARP